MTAQSPTPADGTVLVTGASSGIGLELSRLCAIAIAGMPNGLGTFAVRLIPRAIVRKATRWLDAESGKAGGTAGWRVPAHRPRGHARIRRRTGASDDPGA